jgi:imidazolonepropionase-like amidohydrolase
MLERVRFVVLTSVLIAPVALGADRAEPSLGLRDRVPMPVALVGARIVMAPGKVLDSGTLVVHDGLIEEVGEDVIVPAGSRVIDVTGRTIYPGFIDPLSDYGISGRASPEEPRESDAPRYRGRDLGGRAWNDAVHSEKLWVDWFEPDPDSARRLLERGTTVVHSARADGIFRGRGFVASLASGDTNELILRDDGLHVLSFDKGSSKQAYPSSLMGSIALIRQTLLDARWYSDARRAHDLSPARQAPEFNSALEELAEYDKVFVFESTDELSLLRAARIAEEFDLRLIHVGSHMEWQRADLIADVAQQMILPLRFPAKPHVASFGEQLDASLASLRHWERAPSTAALLAERGVRIAFTGWGLGERENFLDNLRETVGHGLDPGLALAAVTTEPAAMLGISDRVGTLEAGRRANLIVADGDLLKEDAAILEVWVDGRPALELRPLDAADFAGSWSIRLGEIAYGIELATGPDEPAGDEGGLRGTIVRDGFEPVVLRGLSRTRHRLDFAADLGPLGGDGIARFTLRAVGDRVEADVVLADGRMLRSAARPITGAEDEVGGETGRGKAESTARRQELISRVTLPNAPFGFETLPRQENVLLRGATIWTGEEQGVLDSADMLVIEGKIADIGIDLEAPRGVRVINLGGKHVTAGLIDEHSHIAISRGVNEGSHAVTSEVRIGDVVNSDDVAIYRALAGGVTTAQLLHGSANPIGGQAQVIKLRWGHPPEGLKFDAAPPTIKFALGENVKQSNWGDRFRTRYPQTRMGVETVMRDAFLAAREYQRRHEEHDLLDAGARATTAPPRRDLTLEALVEILDSERFVHCHSYRQSEILMLMRLAEQLEFRVQTFTHILEGYKVAPEMAEHGATASSFSDWWAYKFEVYDAIPHNTCLMHEAGVVTSINSDSAEVIRRLNQEAAKSVMYCGMDREEALKLATLNPAIQLRVEDRVGSLAPGKDADFVVWSGDPLSVYSKVEQTWIEGALYFSLESDAELRERDRAEKLALVQKVLETGPEDREGGPDLEAVKSEPEWHCEDVTDVWSR